MFRKPCLNLDTLVLKPEMMTWRKPGPCHRDSCHRMLCFTPGPSDKGSSTPGSKSMLKNGLPAIKVGKYIFYCDNRELHMIILRKCYISASRGLEAVGKGSKSMCTETIPRP